MKKVIAVTGIRSEYDILYPVLNELRQRDFDLSVLVAGAHLSERHGMTQAKIISDGFKLADRVDTLLSTDRVVQRPKAVSSLIQGMTQTIDRESPDFILVVGDREEAIASAIVGNYMNRLVVHLAGGDPTYGNADDPIRFAVSKLSHVHCVFAREYMKNLEAIGEESFRIFWTGNPSYVNINSVPKIGLEEVASELDVGLDRYIVLLQHPLSSELEGSYFQMKETLEALSLFNTKYGYRTVCISPNSDPGSYEIKRAMGEFMSNTSFVFVETLERGLFVNLMRHARALIGNSSMGILEAPYYKLPVINVGNRQRGRLNAGNVRFVSHERSKILVEIERACLDSEYRIFVNNLKNPYGDESAAAKVCDAIDAVDLEDSRWYVKQRLC